jgi:UDP-glucose 4-epimerase
MILVTGGMGFIGLHAARSLLDLGERVLITRYHTTRMPSFLADEVGKSLLVTPLDLTDREAVLKVLKSHSVRSVLHLAVPSRTNVSPVEELIASTSATLGLMRAAIESGIERVTTGSSLAVYFGLGRVSEPLDEALPLPLNASHPIEADKKIDEVIGAFLAASGALQVTRARIGMIWGPTYHTLMNAPSRLAFLALDRRDRLEGRPDPLRAHPEDMLDLMYVRDCGRALAQLQVAKDLRHDVYNVSGGEMVRYGDLVEAFNRAAPGANLVLSPPDRAPIGDPCGHVAIRRLQADTGFAPRFDLDSAVADYLGWLKENPE